jgi:hypothetical protein
MRGWWRGRGTPSELQGDLPPTPSTPVGSDGREGGGSCCSLWLSDRGTFAHRTDRWQRIAGWEEGEASSRDAGRQESLGWEMAGVGPIRAIRVA